MPSLKVSLANLFVTYDVLVRNSLSRINDLQQYLIFVNLFFIYLLTLALRGPVTCLSAVEALVFGTKLDSLVFGRLV